MLNFKIVESQKLIFSKGPVVAADTTNLEAKFEVNDLFDGTLRAYWNVRGSVVDSFKVDLDASGICTIPSEVLASISDPSMYGDIDHILQVSVVSIGEDDTIRITSTTCEIPVYKSSYTGNISQPSKPSGDGNITNIITGAALNGKQLDFYNGNNVIFSAPLDRLDSFLLPLLGGKMQGDINMDGHAITSIPDAENDGDALALAFAKTLFAPSGYGLGAGYGDIQYASDLSTLKKSGWYAFNTSTSDIPISGYGGTVLVSASYELIEQIVFISGFYGAKCRRQMSPAQGETTFSEWEWENAPMLPGVEYRTAKKYNGGAVYCKLIRTTLPAVSSTSKTDMNVTHFCSLSRAVRVSATFYTGHVLPYLSEGIGYSIKSVDSTNVVFRCYGTTWAEVSVDILLYYVK